jgi:hypothetical protein
MDILALGAGWFTGKLLDLAYSRLGTSVLTVANPQLQQMDAQLDRLQDTLERQSTAQLRAAMTFLQLGETEKARDRLVEAEALDNDLGAVPKFILSLLLYRHGHKDLAAQKFREAAKVNPFVTLVPLDSENVLDTGNDLDMLRSGVAPLVEHRTWKKAMERITHETRGDGWWQTYKTLTGRSDASAIIAASLSGGYPVVQWQTSENFAEDTLLFVSAFNMDSGACTWKKQVRNRLLIFAASGYVILRCTKPPRDFEVLDQRNGDVVRRVSDAYFETVMSPSLNAVQHSQSFRRSNGRFQSRRQVLERTSQSSGFIDRLFSSASHSPLSDYTQAVALEDPFNMRAYHLQLTNAWKHDHPLKHEGDSISGRWLETCTLVCEAHVQRAS